MKKIYIIRHGKCQANADKVICGRTESPLTELGRQQAKLAGQIAKKYFHFDLIAHSPLSRAADTARIIANELTPPPPLLQIDNVIERELGEKEGQSYADKDSSSSSPFEEKVPGLETLDNLYNRAKGVLKELDKRPEENILIACHNGIGKMLRIAARDGKSSEFYDEPRLENAVIYEI